MGNSELHISGRQRRLRIIFWLTAATLGALHAWAARHYMNPDGVSYLDMGEAYLRGDWDMAINAHWSPLYSWLLGLAMLILRPSPYWEFSVVHLLNFLIYLCALACFDFFLHELIRYRRGQSAALSGNGRVTLPEWAWLVLGYTLFIWSSLYLITISGVTPDMCLAAFVYLASGILLRIRKGAASWLTFIGLGVILGFGYLTKAAMFPLAFVFLGVSIFSVGNFRKAVPRGLIALAFFLLVASPFIIALSKTIGRPTFGESGRLAYLGYVAASGSPIHPMRAILDDPAVFEFRTPIEGTYPLHYNPYYWQEGMAPRFDLRQQIRALREYVRVYYDIFFDLHGSLIVCLLILFGMSRRRWSITKDISEYWFLFVPAVAALLMYALVLVERRYVGAFVVLLYLGLFSSVRLPDSQEYRRLMACVSLTVLAMFIITLIVPSTSWSAPFTIQRLIKQGTEAHTHWQVADELKRMGIQQGDEVASIGYTYQAYWARLARVKIIAEIQAYGKDRSEVEKFWRADSATKNRVIQGFNEAGARAIVADEVPSWALTDGWQRIGNTGYYAYILSGCK